MTEREAPDDKISSGNGCAVAGPRAGLGSDRVAWLLFVSGGLSG